MVAALADLPLPSMSPLDVDWLEKERATLSSLVVSAADVGLHHYSWRLAQALWRFYYARGYCDEIVHTHQRALVAAEATGDRRATAAINNYPASAYVKTGEHRRACAHLDAAVALSREAGDLQQLLRYQANLSVVHWLRGDLEDAASLGFQLLRERDAYSAVKVPNALPNLGIVLAMLGRYPKALRIHRLHLYLARLNGNEFQLVNALSHIAAVRNRLGQWQQSIRLLTASLAMYRRTGHRYGKPESHNDLGIAYRHLGRLAEARRQHELALELALDFGKRHVQSAALNDLGLTLAADGEDEEAMRRHERALHLATAVSHPYEQGRALAGLAEHFVRTDVAEAAARSSCRTRGPTQLPDRRAESSCLTGGPTQPPGPRQTPGVPG
ncbi:tetratricopeptide repeat protein [Micromonospora deserti]|nr:tetratricopeptide repeat protein [Micromonospora deserti]